MPSMAWGYCSALKQVDGLMTKLFVVSAMSRGAGACFEFHSVALNLVGC